MIDEKKLIEELDYYISHTPEDSGEHYSCNKVKDLICRQPKVGVWIPVSERLPDEPEENPEFEYRRLEMYLVCVDGCKYPFRAFWDGKYFADGFCRVSVTAWQPLPGSFKEEQS